MSHVVRQQGFTLVELTLAMAFIGLLLLAITVMIMQIGAFYNKGTVIAQVNQAGSYISRDIQTAIARSPLLATGDKGEVAVLLQRDNDNVIMGGRFCLGTVSYIWNLGGRLTAPVNRIAGSDMPLHLVKVLDRSKKYCSEAQKEVEQDDMTDLLPEGETVLVLHDIAIHRVAYDAVRQAALYAITLTIGTNDNESLVSADRGGSVSCRAATASRTQQAACEVVQFEFTAQSGGRTEGGR